MHGVGDIALLVQAERHFDHTLVEDLQLGFDAPLDHLLTEVLDRVLRVLEDFIAAEIERAAVEGRHFGEQLRRLQPFVVGHADGTSRRRLDDYVRANRTDSVHNLFEAVFILRGLAVVVAHVQVDDARAGIVGRLGLPGALFHRVGDCGVVFLEYFRSADRGRYDQFFHGVFG